VVPDPVRAPGRPRSAAAEKAILAATVERFIADGYRAMSIEQIAASAGVGKATIYRRWPSKEALVADAVGGLSEQLGAPDTGSVRGDMLDLAKQIAKLSSSAPGQCFARMSGEIASNPELVAIYKKKVIGQRRAVVAQILQRGIDRGELKPDIDIDLAIDMLVGPILFRKLIMQNRNPDMHELSARLIDTLMSGIGTD
jgi:AcrR family transcriptional regulator